MAGKCNNTFLASNLILDLIFHIHAYDGEQEYVSVATACWVPERSVCCPIVCRAKSMMYPWSDLPVGIRSCLVLSCSKLSVGHWDPAHWWGAILGLKVWVLLRRHYLRLAPGPGHKRTWSYEQVVQKQTIWRLSYPLQSPECHLPLFQHLHRCVNSAIDLVDLPEALACASLWNLWAITSASFIMTRDWWVLPILTRHWRIRREVKGICHNKQENESIADMRENTINSRDNPHGQIIIQ